MLVTSCAYFRGKLKTVVSLKCLSIRQTLSFCFKRKNTIFASQGLRSTSLLSTEGSGSLPLASEDGKTHAGLENLT